MNGPTPSLAEVIRSAIDFQLASLHVALPGRVTAYNPTTQTANVQPLISVGYVDETGASQLLPLPIVTSVPVVFPGGGGFRVTFPLSVGDNVLLIFAEASMDVWLHSKGDRIVDPRDPRRHHLSDAIAIPGLRPIRKPLKDAPTDHATIGSDEGAQIHLHDGEIRLGSNAAIDPVALKSDLNSLKATITGWLPVAGDGGAALKTALVSLFSSWPVGAQKVKAE